MRAAYGYVLGNSSVLDRGNTFTVYICILRVLLYIVYIMYFLIVRLLDVTRYTEFNLYSFPVIVYYSMYFKKYTHENKK